MRSWVNFISAFIQADSQSKLLKHDDDFVDVITSEESLFYNAMSETVKNKEKMKSKGLQMFIFFASMLKFWA
jgi:hypothetical protein